jgi:hypothetical protein
VACGDRSPNSACQPARSNPNSSSARLRQRHAVQVDVALGAVAGRSASRPRRRCPRRADHPLQHAQVVAEARPQELAVGALAEPVDVEDSSAISRPAGRTTASGRSSRRSCSRRTASSPSGRGASRRPAPAAAAVVSDPIDAPTSTPCVQSRASNTSGTSEARRPPKTIARSARPADPRPSANSDGHCRALTVKREFGMRGRAVGRDRTGGPASRWRACWSLSMPSHHGWLSAVTATLVKMVSRLDRVASAFGLVLGRGAGRHAEEAGLRVDRVQAAIGAGAHPADVVADRPHLPAGFAIALRRDQHRQVGLAAGGRERRGDVVRLALRVLQAEDQHVLGQPAFLRAWCWRCAAHGTSCRAARCRRSRSRRT